MIINTTCSYNETTYPNLTNFYIGLGLAIFSCFIMGWSYIVKKLSLNRLIASGKRAGDGGFGYLKDWMWWLGLFLMAAGEIINSVAYGFAPASLVTPLGALSVLFTAFLSSKILNEHLNLLGKIGCVICLCGSTIIVLHAPKEQIVNSMVDLSNRFISPGFIIFVCLLLFMVFVLLVYMGPRYGKKNPLIYILISSGIGSLSVMSVKGIGVSIKELFGGKEIWKYWIFYVVLVTLIFGLIIQINYLNKALDLFNTNIVTPLIYVCFTTFVIAASSILLEEWVSLTFVDYFGIIIGFILIIMGFFLLYFFKDCTENSKTSTGIYSCLKLLFTLKRQLSSYLVSTYIPAILIVMVSWLSFWISVEAVPARVTLGLLTLLGILTQNKGVSGNLPRVSYIKAIDIYIIACILFIIGAFTEFAIASNCIRRRRYCMWDKHLRKTISNQIDFSDLKMNRHLDIKSEKQKDETSDKSIFRKRKRNFFSTMPVIKTNSGQTCTIVTLESKPRKSKSAHLRKQIRVIKNPYVTEEEELKRLLLNNYYSGNLVISNESNISEKYYSTNDQFSGNYNKKKDEMDSEDENINDDKSTEYNYVHDKLNVNNLLLDSDLDSYSRFLFPAFFLLYNCFYWLYYLVFT